MSTQTVLLAYIQARAAEISFELDRLECLELITRWNNALTAFAAVTGNEIQGYSIAGRSVQRRAVSEMQGAADDLYQQIMARLYGAGVRLIDHRFAGSIQGDA